MNHAAAPATPEQRAEANRTLLAALVATVVMLFSAFAAAYLERQTSTPVWAKVQLPNLVWINTGVLLLSSLTVEIARRTGRRSWMAVTVALGFVFLAGQLVAWSQLGAGGVSLSNSAYGAFFYILTALHGVHLLGGIIALAVCATRPHVFGLAAGFWHVMGGIWFYVLMVLMLL